MNQYSDDSYAELFAEWKSLPQSEQNFCPLCKKRGKNKHWVYAHIARFLCPFFGPVPTVQAERIVRIWQETKPTRVAVNDIDPVSATRLGTTTESDVAPAVKIAHNILRVLGYNYYDDFDGRSHRAFLRYWCKTTSGECVWVDNKTLLKAGNIGLRIIKKLQRARKAGTLHEIVPNETTGFPEPTASATEGIQVRSAIPFVKFFVAAPKTRSSQDNNLSRQDNDLPTVYVSIPHLKGVNAGDKNESVSNIHPEEVGERNDSDDDDDTDNGCEPDSDHSDFSEDEDDGDGNAEYVDDVASGKRQDDDDDDDDNKEGGDEPSLTTTVSGVPETILDKEYRNNKVWYLVKWRGKPVSLATWEPTNGELLRSHRDLVAAFNNKHKASSQQRDNEQEDGEEKEEVNDETPNLLRTDETVPRRFAQLKPTRVHQPSVVNRVSWSTIVSVCSDIKEVQLLEASCNSASAASRKQLRYALATLVDYATEQTGMTVKQFFQRSSIARYYINISHVKGLWDWFVARHRDHAPSVIANFGNWLVTIFRWLINLYGFQAASAEFVAYYSHITSFIAEQRKPYFIEANKRKRADRRMTNMQARGQYVSRGDITTATTAAVGLLDQLMERTRNPGDTTSTKLSYEEASNAAIAFHFYLTIMLGSPRTSFVIIQFQLGTTLKLLDKDGMIVKNFKNESAWSTGRWVFIPPSIKSQHAPGRSVRETLPIPQELNPYIAWYLAHFRPVLVSSEKVAQYSLFVNSKGAPISEAVRLTWTKYWTRKTIGREVTLQQLRLNIGNHLARDKSITEAAKNDAIRLMDHTKETHEAYYSIEEDIPEEERAKSINPFFKSFIQKK